MIRHVWSVLCRHAFVEPDTDEAALTVLEAFSLPGAPGERHIVGGSFNLVSLWHCDLGSAGFSYLVKVTGPTGKALTDNEVSVAAFLAPKLGARLEQIHTPAVGAPRSPKASAWAAWRAQRSEHASRAPTLTARGSDHQQPS